MELVLPTKWFRQIDRHHPQKNFPTANRLAFPDDYYISRNNLKNITEQQRGRRVLTRLWMK